MEISNTNVLKAIILYLDELGFDFEKNSAMDLIRSVGEIGKLAGEDMEMRDRILYYLDKLSKGDNYS